MENDSVDTLEEKMDFEDISMDEKFVQGIDGILYDVILVHVQQFELYVARCVEYCEGSFGSISSRNSLQLTEHDMFSIIYE